MKKWVIVESIGTWERKNGKTIIDCRVRESRVYGESNELLDLVAPVDDMREDGTWHSYCIHPRKYAKRIAELVY